MRAFTLAFALVTMLCVSPVFGQQPTEKPEIPAGDGAVYAEVVKTLVRDTAVIRRFGSSNDVKRLDPRICLHGFVFNAQRLQS